MRALPLALWALLMFTLVVEVASITNQEFFETVRPYATEIETVDEVDEEDDDELGVIELPGGPDDELDIEYLMEALENDISMPSTREIEFKEDTQNVGWRFRGGRCRCSRNKCYCCIYKKFKVKVIFKRIRFKLNACVTVRYLRRSRGFSITVKFNGRRLYHREISLRHPPRLCYGIPGFRYAAKVCLQIYNVNLRRKSMCVRLEGIVNLRVKKYRIRVKLACFRLRLLDEDLQALEAMTNHPDLVEMNTLATVNGSAIDESRDFSYALLAAEDISHLFEDIEELSLDMPEYYDDNED